MMDLGDVVHRRDAVVELGEPSEQLANVDVLWPVDRREAEENGCEVGEGSLPGRFVGTGGRSPSRIGTPSARKLRSAVSNW
jgi:hypothetical protein